MHLTWILATLGPAVLGTKMDDLDHLRSSLCEVGDLDGDGVPDVVVGSRDAASPEVVWAISERSGRLLWTLPSERPGDGFGASLAGVADLDGDGIGDLLVTAPGYRQQWGRPTSFGHVPGRVVLVSGATGTTLRELSCARWFRPIDLTVASAGDLDDDGVEDLLVGCAMLTRDLGFVHAFSARTGALLQELTPRWGDGWISSGGFGTSTCGTSDLDGDGVQDIAVTDPGASRPGRGNLGCITVFSGRTGTEICRIGGDVEGDALGWTIAPIADLDGDGRSELCATGMDRCAKILAGSDLSQLGPTIVRRAHVLHSWGQSFTWIDDMDADGLPDLAVGANESAGDFAFDSGFVIVYSPKDGSTLWTPYTSEFNGVDVASSGDLDGDGLRDLVLSIVGPRTSGELGQEIRAISTRTREVIFDVFAFEMRGSGPSREMQREKDR